MYKSAGFCRHRFQVCLKEEPLVIYVALVHLPNKYDIDMILFTIFVYKIKCF